MATPPPSSSSTTVPERTATAPATADPPAPSAPGQVLPEAPAGPPSPPGHDGAGSAPPPRGGRPRLHEDRRATGLDGLRGLAAFSVFLFHVWLYTRAPGRWSTAEIWVVQLRVCVICFFVLSGFLLYRPFARAARRRHAVDVKLYYRRRISRILPAYWLMLPVVYFTLKAIDGARGVRLPQADHLWLFPIMGQNYSSFTVMKLNSVTWTLAIEVLFYALLPLLGLFAFRLARGRRGPQVAMCLTIIAIGLVWHGWVFDHQLSQLYSKALPAYAPYFALGMLAALYLEWRIEHGRPWLTGRETWVATLAGIALVVFNGVWHGNSGGPRSDWWVAVAHDMPSGLGFMLLTVAAAAGLGRVIGWTRVRPLVGLGVVSYGFYLWHVPVVLFVHHLGILGGNGVVVLFVALPISIALACASWFGIERPLIARAHRRSLVRSRA